jgi:hypothetical protein
MMMCSNDAIYVSLYEVRTTELYRMKSAPPLEDNFINFFNVGLFGVLCRVIQGHLLAFWMTLNNPIDYYRLVKLRSTITL